MHAARRRDDAPPVPDLATVIAGAAETRDRAWAAAGRAETILDAIEHGAEPPEWITPYQLSLIAAGLRGVGAGSSALADKAEMLAGRIAVAEAERAMARGTGFREGVAATAGRHRAPGRSRRPGRGQLALIPGEGKGAAVLSGVAVGAAKIGHAVTGHAAIPIAVGATAATFVIGAGAVHNLPDIIQGTPSQQQAQTFGGVAPVTAIPISLPSSEPSYEPRHAKPTPDAASATAVPPPAPVITLAPPSQQPPSSPSPQPSAAASGVLTIQTAQLRIGIGGAGMLTFYSENGALQWTASATPGLSLDQSSGILGSGQSVTLTVYVARGLSAGTGWVTIMAGSQQETVPVTWISLGL